MACPVAAEVDRVRTAEVIAALSLATDLGIGVPLEHGLQSTLYAMRLADRLGVDAETGSHTYYACLLFYVGCTAGAETASELFGDERALMTYAGPVRFGSRTEMMGGIVRAIAPPGQPVAARAVRLASRLPKVARAFPEQVATFCQVAQMLTDRLGLPGSIKPLFAHFSERWDGKGDPAGARGEEIPLAVRITHVARDVALQRMLGGDEHAVEVVSKRAGGAFDPSVAACLARDWREILALDAEEATWDRVLASEPSRQLVLEGESIDAALRAMGSFADLISRYLVGHSGGVAQLAETAARRLRLAPDEVIRVRRAALVHDLGRVTVPVRIWQKAGPLTSDEREQVRLHAYHSERVLARSPFLASLAAIAGMHHERLDGSGYHRGSVVAALPVSARLIAAADAYHAMTEPRPHRAALAGAQAAERLREEARAGRLDPDAVSAVVEAAGHPPRKVERPAGLTKREAQVVGLLARGAQTKQVAHVLGISVKTADSHVQNAYRKIGVSTRAAAAVFAMEHGLTVSGELPIDRR
ncbi:MAG: HD domain-containing protein [Actinomycetota bacterium]|nr:HD domain-containing protein [Actinomycetota bacterium]